VRWLALALGGAALAGVAVGVEIWSWSLESIATTLQLVGIVLSLVGVGVIRGWLFELASRTALQAARARRALSDQWALRREQLRLRWARLRGRAVPANLSGSAHGSSSVSANLTVARARINRDAASNREWLAWLDNRVEMIFVRLDQEEKARDAMHVDLVQRLASQREVIRAEIEDATHRGWELVVSGLACSAAGTVLGALA